MVQVTPTGIIHIKQDKKRNWWKIDRSKINRATSNSRQVAISIEGGELTYFELNSLGHLIEVESKLFDSEIICLDVGPIPEGR
jgi:splicing factor 3B subunit 3